MIQNPKPLVSVCCISFNQAPYIRQCLEGIIMQKTTFPFEIILNDDASADGTAEIIKEYQRRFPYLLKPLFHSENQYSKGIRTILATFCYPRCQGKYIAICEGDDYWTDPLKLQKQVDFMEAHPECAMCFSRAVFHLEADGKDYQFGDASDRFYSGPELFRKWIVPTASLLFRKDVLLSPLYSQVVADKKFIFGDTPLVLTCASLGKVYGISDITCAYRKHGAGVTAKVAESSERLFNLRNHYLEIPRVFGKEYLSDAKMSAVKTCLKSVVKDVKFQKQIPWKKLIEMQRISFWYSIRACVRYFVNLIKHE